MKHLTAADREALAEQLRVMKRAVLDEIRGTAVQLDATIESTGAEVRNHADEAADERLDDVRFAEIEIDRTRLHDIEQAEQRMAKGSYGVCADCNEEIPRERLMAQPIAIRCAACQSAAEARHRH